MAVSKRTFKSLPLKFHVAEGQELPDDHPVVKRHPDAFDGVKPKKAAAKKTAAATDKG